MTLTVLAAMTFNVVGVPIPMKVTTHIDIQTKANHSLDEALNANSYPGNHFGSLPRGKQNLGGISFQIGKKLIQLQSQIIRAKPERIEGIKVGHRFTEIHFLHATTHDVKDGTKIGEYVIHYLDKGTRVIPIHYGKEVRDWWYGKKSKGIEKGKVAWTGTNKGAESLNMGIRLYSLSWKNPRPGVRVESIDFVSEKTRCGPFCVAITTEKR